MDNTTGANIIGSNIISSLGFTAEENFSIVKQGISGIKHYDTGVFKLPEAFMSSLINKEKLNDEFLKISSKNIYTNLEKAAILSVFYANTEAKIDLSNKKTIFILSTTKGNVELLEIGKSENQKIYIWHTAELITRFFNNPNTPIAVSNACISGAAAQIVAMRELQSGNYDHAVVVGVDLLSKFIISGFQSFKALSPELCRPFDKARCGLNLGEAAATIIFSREIKGFNGIKLTSGTIRNDATHISAPSRTGEGSYRALMSVLQNIDLNDIAFLNAHGTATSYNDAMEMNAIVRAGLAHLPVNGLKAYFGHTLGAAGILESIISMKALNIHIILKTLGCEEQDNIIINNVEHSLNINKENRNSNKKIFIKMISGFGGVNAVLCFSLQYRKFKK